MPMLVHDTINNSLSRFIHPVVNVGRRWSAFQRCGYAGLALAITLSLALAARLGLSLWVILAIAAVTMATFFMHAFATKIIKGHEELVYYHHELAILTTVLLLLWLWRQPISPYLDITALGIGAFMILGRIGCLSAGCCHGRPARWGIRYGEAQAAVGFAGCYVGVRLFPIQAVESLWALALVLVGCAMLLNGSPPGAVFALYIVGYDVGRFCFEFARGDAIRSYYGGFSEAQWLAIILTWAVVAAEVSGVLPFQLWHMVAAVGLTIAALAITMYRRISRGERHRLLHPSHIQEIAEAIVRLSDNASATPTGVRVEQTSLGIRMSAGANGQGTGAPIHYTLSRHDGQITDADVATLAELILRLTQSNRSWTCIRGNHGVAHVLMRTSPDTVGEQSETKSVEMRNR